MNIYSIKPAIITNVSLTMADRRVDKVRIVRLPKDENEQ